MLPRGVQSQISIGLVSANAVPGRIVSAESNGHSTAKNKLSSAAGAGQFLESTWLEMISDHRPDLLRRSKTDLLSLREDPLLSREMVARFSERNADYLMSHCLPVTSGTLYLAHFAGKGGAAALLSAPAIADAAEIMAQADSTGQTTREMIVGANPFLENFSVADLRNWAARKMSMAQTRLSGP